MKYVLWGSSEFSVAIFEKLISEYYQPSVVITQPDKPAGRKQTPTSPPIKEACFYHNIECWQPNKLNQIIPKLKKLAPDMMIVASYGKIIPKEIIEIPYKGILNVHPSLLPKYRGASPIQTAILNGDEQTGISFIKMDEQMDHGDIIYQESLDIAWDDNSETLEAKLVKLAGDRLFKIIPYYLSGKITPIPQNDNDATFTKLINKDDAKINWNNSADQINRKIRAFKKWPTAWTVLPNGKKLKIYKAIPEVIDKTEKHKDGTLVMENKKLIVTCDKSQLQILLLQVEGKKITEASDFILGYKKINHQVCQ